LSSKEEELVWELDAIASWLWNMKKKDGWLTTSARSLADVKRLKEDEVIAISAACSHLGYIYDLSITESQ
jgi:hypothetical protein